MTERCLGVVVGGGVSGLVAARELSRAGYDVTVLEASSSWGGAVSPLTIGGVITDAGAESIGIARSTGRDLLRDVGLDDDVVEPRRTDSRIAFADGKFQLPPTVLGIPANTDDPRLLAAIGADALERMRNEVDCPITPFTTIGELVRTRLGARVVERLVDPIVSGVHALSADEADLAALVPNIDTMITSFGGLVAAAHRMRSGLGPSGSAVISLRGGLHRMVDALVSSCCDMGVEMCLASEISEIRRNTDGWTVVSTDGCSRTADVVVIAIPPGVASRLIRSVDADIADALSSIEMTPVNVVTMYVVSSELDTFPIGPGMLVSSERTDVSTKAMTHSNAKWIWWDDVLPPHHHLIRLSYGRAGQPSMTHDEIRAVVERDARTLLELREPWHVVDMVVTTWASSLVRPSPGHAARMKVLAQDVEQITGLAIVSGALCGNGLAGVVDFAQRQSRRLGSPTEPIR